MALYDLADLTMSLPSQLVLDSSLLLALRKEDDNPRAEVAHRFIGWLGRQIAGQQTVAWLLTSVLQECYHVIYLLPQDALILAETERLGVTAVATLDSDWRRVTEFDIYTAPI